MKTFARILAPARVALALLVVAPALSGRAGAEPGQRYKCPPCGSPCDTTTFFAPGVCPTCGMTLVDAASASARPDPNQKRVAILVFDSCEILDFTGPYEMFGAAGCDVYTVAAKKDPITTAMGLTVVPRYTFADAPQPDVLVIPGGGVKAASEDDATLAYIRKATEGTRHTMSVCNGAFILANTGLLDGLTATTTSGNIPRMAQKYPKIKVVRDQRYVDNGQLVTTAGLSAGMDGALHVIAKLFGTGYAQGVALSEEYDWQATSKYARAALADQQIPELGIDSLATWDVERTEGDTRHWDVVANGKLKVSEAELESHIEKALVAGKWTRVAAPASSGATHASTWHFTGNDGKRWKAKLELERLADARHDVKASLSVARVE
jgi:putative intracellular protease/amidase